MLLVLILYVFSLNNLYHCSQYTKVEGNDLVFNNKINDLKFLLAADWQKVHSHCQSRIELHAHLIKNALPFICVVSPWDSCWISLNLVLVSISPKSICSEYRYHEVHAHIKKCTIYWMVLINLPGSYIYWAGGWPGTNQAYLFIN